MIEPELRGFLRSRRARITPEQAGLPPQPGARRVPGLRREEVARLAGVSVDYYVRLERGRSRNVSDVVLKAIARTLRLDDTERDHLFALARPARPDSDPAPDQRMRPAMQRILEGLTDSPALAVGRRWDVLGANRLARALYTDFDALPPRDRNIARYMFLDESTRTLFADWAYEARRTVAGLHLYAGRHPDDRALADLVGELSAQDPDFRRWWAEHHVFRRTFGTKRLRHPLVGDITLQYEAMAPTGDPDQLLGVYTAEPGSPSEQALQRLARTLT